MHEKKAYTPEASAKSRMKELDAQLKLCKSLIFLKTFNLKLNTACKNLFFASVSFLTLFCFTRAAVQDEEDIMDFEPIALERQDEYLSLLRISGTNASDYSFANLWGWAEEYGLMWAFDPDRELVWLQQTKPWQVYWAPIGRWEQDWTDLCTYFGPGTRFTRVPDQLATIWEKQLEGAEIEEAREHWDYIYPVQQLIELKGNKLHKKKNLLNQFLRNNDFQYVDLTPGLIEDALTLQSEWCLWKECEDSESLEAENGVIVRVFHDWEYIRGLFGAGLLIEGHMIAYTVAERLSPDTVVVHFEKGCPQYKGVYQAMNQLFVRNTAYMYEWVNREQDLGDPGLRKAKSSYLPQEFSRKYEVRF